MPVKEPVNADIIRKNVLLYIKRNNDLTSFHKEHVFRKNKKHQ